MKNNISLNKYPNVAIEHTGNGKIYYVEVIYQDKILKDEVPIRFFELNPTSQEITQMIDNNINDFGEPKKIVVYWGNTKFFVPFWVWIALLVVGLGAVYFYMGDLRFTFSLGSMIIGAVILFAVFWIISTIDKMGRGMSIYEAINPFLTPYDMYNDTFRNGMDFARKVDKKSRFLHYKDYLD